MVTYCEDCEIVVEPIAHETTDPDGYTVWLLTCPSCPAVFEHVYPEDFDPDDDHDDPPGHHAP